MDLRLGCGCEAKFPATRFMLMQTLFADALETCTELCRRALAGSLVPPTGPPFVTALEGCSTALVAAVCGGFLDEMEGDGENWGATAPLV